MNQTTSMLRRRVEGCVDEICLDLTQRGAQPTCVHIARLTGAFHEFRWIDGFSRSILVDQVESMLIAGGIEETFVEIVVGHSERSIFNNGVVRLPRQIERGLTGLALRCKDRMKRVSPSTMRARDKGFRETFDALTRSFSAATEMGIPIDIDTEGTDVIAFSTCQFVISSAAGEVKALPVFRGKPIVRMEEVSFERISAMARSMADWMTRNVAADGKITYCYYPSKDTIAPNTNRIREFMGSIALFRASRYFDDATMLAAAERNLAYNVGAYYREDEDYGVITEGSKVKLGAAALAAVAMRQTTRGAEYETQLARLTRFTELMWKETGQFRTFLRPNSLDGKCQNFYPGETLLYWAERWVETRDTTLWRQIEKSFDYYRDWHQANRNPAFVPWHSQAYYLLWQATGEDRFKEFILEMNDWLLPLQQWESIADFPDAQGRFYDPGKPFGPPHASSTGVYLEGLADAFLVAKQTGEELRAARYARTILRGLRNVMQLHFSLPYECVGFANQQKTLGGVRTTEYNNTIRIDNVQHNLMALLKILRIPDFFTQLDTAPVEQSAAAAASLKDQASNLVDQMGVFRLAPETERVF